MNANSFDNRHFKIGFTATILVILAALMAIGLATASRAAGDPLRCKDTAGNLPGMMFHVCQLPGGMISSCMSGFGVVVGDPCRQYPASSLAPDFWNN
jgi:hypothetical protein